MTVAAAGSHSWWQDLSRASLSNSNAFIEALRKVTHTPDNRNVAWRNWTALHYCGECGCEEGAALLIDGSASVDLEVVSW